MDTKLRFSKNFWLVMGRLLWLFNLTKRESRKDTVKRAKEFIDKLQNEGDKSVLVVSHGLFLKVLAKELKNSGFSGNVDFRIKSGKIYRLIRDKYH